MMNPHARQRIRRRVLSLSEHLAKFKKAGPEDDELLHKGFGIIRHYDSLAQELYRLRASVPADDVLRKQVEDTVSSLAQELIALKPGGRAESSPYARWKSRYHRIWRENIPLFVVAAAIFVTSLLTGWIVTTRTPEYASVLIPHHLIEDILHKERWFGHLESAPLAWGLLIAWNNIWVSINCFLMGILFGLGTLYVLIFNGIAIGGIMGFCYVHGFHRELTNFVLGHGPLELSIIVAAAFAGFLFGRVFYMRPFRSVVARIPRAASDALCVMYGILPWLMLAAAIEAGLSPAPQISTPVKLLVGLIAALCFWLWTFAGGRVVNDPPGPLVRSNMTAAEDRRAVG